MVIVRCSRCTTGYRMDPARVPSGGMRVRCPSCGHVFRVRLRRPDAGAPAPQATTPRPQRQPAPEPLLPGLQTDDGSSLLGTAPPAVPTGPLGTPLRATPENEPPARPQPPSPTTWSRGEQTLDLDGSAGEPAPRPTLETAPFRPGAQAPAPRPRPARTPAPAVTPRGEVQSRTAPVVPSAPLSQAALPRDHQRARRLARVLISDILVYNQEARDKALAEGNLVTALAGEVNKAWELYKSKVADDVLGDSDYFKDALNEILADGRKVF